MTSNYANGILTVIKNSAFFVHQNFWCVAPRCEQSECATTGESLQKGPQRLSCTAKTRFTRLVSLVNGTECNRNVNVMVTKLPLHLFLEINRHKALSHCQINMGRYC